MEINDKVEIIPFEVKGKIIGIYLSNAPAEYRVRFFMDSEVKQEYFNIDELKKV